MLQLVGSGFLYAGATWLWLDVGGNAALLLMLGAACSLVSTLKGAMRSASDSVPR